MSFTISLSGNSAELSASFNPPIFLDNGDYAVCLTNFETYNAIPNIDERNNKFRYGNKTITIPTGAYELDDIEDYLQNELSKDHVSLTLHANNNTLRCHLKCSENVQFTKDSIGTILGFKEDLYIANEIHISQKPAEIIKVNAILVDCSIADGSYLNNDPVHVIHQFFPSVGPGFKIIEAPQNLIYFPVNVKTITNIFLKIIDQDGDLVNFSGETITIRLHIKKLE